MKGRGGYQGVTWPKVNRGICSKHGEPVGDVTGICFRCHLEQMAAVGHKREAALLADLDVRLPPS